MSIQSKKPLADDTALQWLVLLQSPSLSEQQEAAFFEWLNASPANQQAFIAAESLWQRGGALSKTSREAHGFFSWRKAAIFTGWNVGAFAGVCALLVVAVFFGFQPDTAVLQYQTAFGEQKQITLSDGSVVTLNANSELLVDLGSKQSRTLILSKGEVFFDVAPDKTRPFTVKTEEGLVVVLGTRFSVSKSKADTQVTVIEGRVGLLPEVDAWHGQESKSVLHANQRMALDARESMPQTVDAEASLSWRTGQMRFEGEMLKDVVEALNAYYDSSLGFDDETLGSKRVVAIFPLSNSLEANLKHLTQALNLRYQSRSDGAITLIGDNKNQ